MLGRIPANPAKPLRAYRHEEAESSPCGRPPKSWRSPKPPSSAGASTTLFYLALTAGLHAGELMALEWTDPKRDRLRISRTASVKGSVGPTKCKAGCRILTLPADTLEVLQQHKRGLREAGLDSPLLFPTSSGSMVNHSNLRRCLHAWAHKAGVPRIRVHDLRHTYASMAISAGVNAAELAR